ncbi:MFS transporter [Novosphingobium mangrovi (ex Hu et al. 2023)]|uniref:MFS transporter n=1 Tax=Novosphingobium mangrovi (ex Hu et al. 2023) TaxID=2930094 RepID=A0ABT0AE58_9SPHN|nr:MFS transporter [Novosphingobium mangrovi (ex Hu et al. 2023)]MCJ1961466.1 MFS transporter [Novosphingobium mangrovi (ex Hu et al. 2023)]
MRPHHREHLITLSCASVLFTAGYALQAFAFSMPGLVRDWKLDAQAVGPLLASAMLGLMLGYLALSPLAERIGARVIVAGAMVSLSLATLASLAAPGILTLAACRGVIGAASGAAIPAAVAIVSQQGAPRWQGARVVATYTAYSLGFLAAAGLSGWLIPEAGWRAAWVPGVPFALAAALGALALPRRAARTAPRHPHIHGPRALLDRNRRLGTLLFWILFPAGLCLFYALQSWLPLLATEGGIAFSGAVALTGIFTLGNMLGAVPMIWWADRMGPFRALAAMGLFSLAGLALLVVGLNLTHPLLLAAALLAGIGIGGSQKGMTSAASLFYPPAIRTTGLGYALGIGRIGAVGGPLLLGLGHGSTWLGLALALPVLILVLAPLWLDRRYGRIDCDGPPPPRQNPERDRLP